MEVKEVKRNAGVGEWIKIVKEEISNNKYRDGDILQVRETNSRYGTGSVFCNGVDIFISSDEYVVLENYQPIEEYREKENDMKIKEVKRLANVGEFIKIVDESWTEGEYANGDILEVERIDFSVDLDKTYCKGIEIYLDEDEYVVLENYKPIAESRITSETPIKQLVGKVLAEGVQETLYYVTEHYLISNNLIIPISEFDEYEVVKIFDIIDTDKDPLEHDNLKLIWEIGNKVKLGKENLSVYIYDESDIIQIKKENLRTVIDKLNEVASEIGV